MSIRLWQIPGCVGRVGFFGFLAVASDCRLAARGQPRKMFFHNLSGFWYCASVWNRLDSAADDHWSSFVQTKPGYQPRKGFCMLDRVG